MARPARLVRVVFIALALGAGASCGLAATSATALVPPPPPPGVGYNYDCTASALPGLHYGVVVFVSGQAPPSVQQGSTFTLHAVTTVATYPVSLTLDRGALQVRPNHNGATAGHDEVVTVGPVSLIGGVPFSAGPVDMTFRAIGAVGSHIEFVPRRVTATLEQYGNAVCTRVSRQPAFARTTIVAGSPQQFSVTTSGTCTPDAAPTAHYAASFTFSGTVPPSAQAGSSFTLAGYQVATTVNAAFTLDDASTSVTAIGASASPSLQATFHMFFDNTPFVLGPTDVTLTPTAGAGSTIELDAAPISLNAAGIGHGICAPNFAVLAQVPVV